ncbi:MAG: CarD family transcriptional regulator [Eubacteriales bacterium]|nr:CarD family transcriptional regulator [Eubacteriales bacterium]
MYSKGDYVVKANTGICMVEGTVMKRLTESSDEKEYYCLAPLADSRSKVFVSVASEKSNLRMAMTESEAWKLIHDIPSIEVKWIESDKYREQEYKNAMRSNDPRDLVSIIKNLYIRNKEREEKGKKVTAIDDRYFKMAENALYSEIAHALKRDKDDMKQLIVDTIGS